MVSLAVDNGLNPNLLRRWVLEYEWLGLPTLDACEHATLHTHSDQRTPTALWSDFVPLMQYQLPRQCLAPSIASVPTPRHWGCARTQPSAYRADHSCGYEITKK